MKRSPASAATSSRSKQVSRTGRPEARRHSAHLETGAERSGGPEVGGEPSAGMIARVKEAVLHLLSHHERLLLVLWYVERMTIAEIARTLNLSVQQADRMHAEVLLKLRAAA